MSILYIVPTPIGNLKDITLRALEVLESADFILCEDTRTSSNLLRHFNIDKKTFAFHQHNEHKMVENLIERIRGNKVALISDAGTPGISDPAYLLVKACISNSIEVISLPGATAFVPAIVNSGLPSDSFYFHGFLPHKKGRIKILETIKANQKTAVLYESPHRIVKALEQIAEVFGEEHQISISREITKIHEQTLRGTATELKNHFENVQPKGEFVVVISPFEK